MNTRIRISLFVATTFFFCGSFLVVRSVLTQSAQNSPQATISLRERAKREGKVTIQVFPHSLDRYDSLEALKKDSSAIILGTVTSRAGRLHSEDAVSMDYIVRVDDTLKGDLQKESLVRVNQLGGKLSFEDGTSVEMVTPDYWKTPQVQKSYVLFLSPKDVGEYRLVGGPQGLFEVGASGLKPQGLATDELFRAHYGMSLKKFAERIRGSVEQRAALRGRAANFKR